MATENSIIIAYLKSSFSIENFILSFKDEGYEMENENGYSTYLPLGESDYEYVSVQGLSLKTYISIFNEKEAHNESNAYSLFKGEEEIHILFVVEEESMVISFDSTARKISNNILDFSFYLELLNKILVKVGTQIFQINCIANFR